MHNIKVAGIVFGIQSDIPIRGFKSKKLLHFQVSNRKPDIYHSYCKIPDDTITLHPLDKHSLSLLNKSVCHSGHNLFDNPLFNSHIVRDKLNLCLPHIDSVSIEIKSSSIVLFDHKLNEIHAFYSQDYGKILVDFVFGSSMFSPFLSNFSAAMIHSSSVVLDNKTAIFLAPDEGGKTTAAELASGFPILCDDQNIIRKQGDEYEVHGTPWGIHRESTFNAKLGGFFLLVKGKEFKLTKFDHKEILNYLLNEHLPYYYCLPKKIKLEYFNFIYDLSKNTPGFELVFPKDHINWDEVSKAMKI